MTKMAFFLRYGLLELMRARTSLARSLQEKRNTGNRYILAGIKGLIKIIILEYLKIGPVSTTVVLSLFFLFYLGRGHALEEEKSQEYL